MMRRLSLFLLLVTSALRAQTYFPPGGSSASAFTGSLGTAPLTETWVVGTGGVTANTLVQMDSSAPAKIVSSTTGAYGIAVSTVSAAGSVEVARLGTASCLADTGGAVTGHLAVLGTGTVNRCKDSGQTSSASLAITVRIIGVFRSTVAAGAAALVELTPAHFGTGNVPTLDGNNTFTGTMTVTGGPLSAPIFISSDPFSASGQEQSKPLAPASGSGLTWFDSTAHIPQYEGSAGTVLGTMTVPKASRTANQFGTYVDAAGVQQTAGVAAADLPTITLTGDTTGAASGGSVTTATSKLNGNTPGNTCTNQFTRSIDSSARGTCATVVATDTDSSVAHTGVDINTSHQVTVTHLASPLSVAQGGSALVTQTAHALYAGNGTSAPVAVGPDASTTKALFSAGSSADPAFRAIAAADLPASPFVHVTAGTGGTTANTLVKFDTDGTAIAVTSTESILGIAQTTATVGNPVAVSVIGPASCVAEGTITAGHYLIAGSTDPKHCKDSGQTTLNLISLATRVPAKASAAATDGQTVAVALIGAYRFGAQVTAADLPATPLPTPGTSITLTAPRGYAICTGTCTVTVPVPAAGYEFCVLNDDNVATAITLASLGSSAMYENSARTAYGTAGTGTLVVAAAAANKVCIVGRDSTHYLTVSNSGGAVTVN